MNLTLRVWRQASPSAPGRLVDYKATGISPDMSFLEMLDVVNEGLIKAGQDPIAFDSDCREGICGTCGCMVNGVAHGPDADTTVCQLHMRRFKDGDTIVIEPWRARAFPILKDLVVDRSAFDRIIQAGGYTSINVGSAPDGNAILVPKAASDEAMDYAAVHRLRRLRGVVQERLGGAVHGGQGLAPGAAAAGPAGAPDAGPRHGRHGWTRKASAPARTRASAKRPARRASRSPASPG